MSRCGDAGGAQTRRFVQKTQSRVQIRDSAAKPPGRETGPRSAAARIVSLVQQRNFASFASYPKNLSGYYRVMQPKLKNDK